MDRLTTAMDFAPSATRWTPKVNAFKLDKAEAEEPEEPKSSSSSSAPASSKTPTRDVMRSGARPEGMPWFIRPLA
jgi:hypothetical protein